MYVKILVRRKSKFKSFRVRTAMMERNISIKDVSLWTNFAML